MTWESFKQLARVIRHEDKGIVWRISGNTGRWAWNKYVLKRRYMEKEIHGMEMVFDLSDSGICRSLLIVGDREREHRYILEKVVRDEDVILDLGANIGYYVLMEHRLLKGTGRVIAVEPEIDNYNLLRINIKRNGFDHNTKFYNAAVAEKDGKAKLYLSKLGNVHSMIEKNTDSYSGKVSLVNTISLNTLLKNEKRIDLVRMDIEGFEQNVLESLIKINSKIDFKPKILFELHPVKYNQKKFIGLIQDLAGLGYMVKYLACSNKVKLKDLGIIIENKVETDGKTRFIAKDLSIEQFLQIYNISRAVLLVPGDKK